MAQLEVNFGGEIYLTEATLDLDGDGVNDAVVADLDGDGANDEIAWDSDGDGVIDTILYASHDDGNYDTGYFDPTGTGSGGPNGTAAAAYALLASSGGRILTHATIRSTGVAPFDTVNMISCENGICVALPDPGAHGQGAAPDPGVQAP